MTDRQAFRIARQHTAIKTLAEEVLRLREELATMAESSRVNYEAFSDQLCRHKVTMEERDKLREVLNRTMDLSDDDCPYCCDSSEILRKALEVRP